MASKIPAKWVVLGFMATVTCFVLAMALAEVSRGLAHAPTAFVYALTAAFGLEYLISAWGGDERQRQRQPER
jgi:hypothetical protein